MKLKLKTRSGLCQSQRVICQSDYPVILRKLVNNSGVHLTYHHESIYNYETRPQLGLHSGWVLSTLAR